MAYGRPNDAELRFKASLEDDVSPQLDQLEKKLRKAGASPAEVKMMLRAYDEATPKLDEARKRMALIPKEHIIRIKAKTDDVSTSIKNLKKDAEGSPIKLNFISNLKEVTDQLFSLRGKVPIPMGGSIPGSSMLYAGGMGAAAMAPIAGMAGIVQQGVQVNAKMEQSLVTLQQTLKDNAQATQEMGKLVQVAQKTPFQYSDVLQADVRLRSYNIPTMPGEGGPGNQGWLKSAGDMAASMNTPITQAVEAIADARQGYFVRMMSYGIRMMREDFQAGGKFAGQTYEQGLAQAIRRFEGAQEAQSKTFTGVMSNLKDILEQQVIKPIGAPAFAALKTSAQGLQDRMMDPDFQQKLGKEIQGVQQWFVKMFQTIQRGKEYFQTHLQQPLMEFGKEVIHIGSIFLKTFGGAMMEVFKALSTLIAGVVQPLTKFVSGFSLLGHSIPETLGYMKAMSIIGFQGPLSGLQKMGESLFRLRPSITGVIQGFGMFQAGLVRAGLLFVVKHLTDASRASTNLENSLKDAGDAGVGKFRELNAEIAKAAGGLGSTGAHLRNLTAEGVRNTGDPNLALYQGKTAASLEQRYGIGGDYAMRMFGKAGAGNEKATDAAATALVNLKNAADNLGKSMSDMERVMGQYAGPAGAVGLGGMSGAPYLAAMEDAFSKPGFLNKTQMDTGITSGSGLLTQLLGRFKQPTLEDMKGIGLNNLDSTYRFGSNINFRRMYNTGGDFQLPTNPNVDERSIGRGRQLNDIIDRYSANFQAQGDQQAAINKITRAAGAPTINMPNMVPESNRTDLAQLRSVRSALQRTEDPVQQGQILANAINNTDVAMQQNEKTITDLTEKTTGLNKTIAGLAVAQERGQLQIQAFQHSLVPMQHAIEDAQLAMQKYQQSAMRPLERQMQRLGQESAEMGNKMSNAQYAMSKFSTGLLEGEQAALNQLHALERYNKELQLMQLQYQQIGADIGQTTFDRGARVRVEPLAGINLASQMERAQRKSQIANLKYELGPGEGHYQMQQAARSANERREMPLGERLKGIRDHRTEIDKLDISQHNLQNRQFALSTASYNAGQKLQDMQDHVTDLSIALQDKQLHGGLRGMEEAQYQIGRKSATANLELNKQNTIIETLKAKTEDYRDAKQKYTESFYDELIFGGSKDKSFQKLMDFAEKSGIMDPSQIKAARDAVSETTKGAVNGINTKPDMIDAVKQGVKGVFTGDTWDKLGDVADMYLHRWRHSRFVNAADAGITAAGRTTGIHFPTLGSGMDAVGRMMGSGVTAAIVTGITLALTAVIGAGVAKELTKYGLGGAVRALGGYTSMTGRGALGHRIGQFGQLVQMGPGEFLTNREQSTLPRRLLGRTRLLRTARGRIGGGVGGVIGGALGSIFGPTGSILGGLFGSMLGSRYAEARTIRGGVRAGARATRTAYRGFSGMINAVNDILDSGKRSVKAGELHEAAAKRIEQAGNKMRGGGDAIHSASSTIKTSSVTFKNAAGTHSKIVNEDMPRQIDKIGEQGGKIADKIAAKIRSLRVPGGAAAAEEAAAAAPEAARGSRGLARFLAPAVTIAGLAIPALRRRSGRARAAREAVRGPGMFTRAARDVAATPTGRFVGRVGSVARRAGRFLGPLGIALDVAGAAGAFGHGRAQSSGRGSLIGGVLGGAIGTPFGLTVPGAAIGSTIGGIAGNFWPEIKKAFTKGAPGVVRSAVRGISHALSSVGKSFSRATSSIGKWMGRLPQRAGFALGRGAHKAVDWVTQKLPGIVMGVGRKLYHSYEDAHDWLTKKLPKIILDFFGKELGLLVKGYEWLRYKMPQIISDWFKTLPGKFEDGFHWLTQKLPGIIGDFVANIGKALSDAFTNVKKLIFGKDDKFTFSDVKRLGGDFLKAVVPGSGFLGKVAGSVKSGWESVDGSHAGGIARVPRDSYVAELHKDEAVLTAAEAHNYRQRQRSFLDTNERNTLNDIDEKRKEVRRELDHHKGMSNEREKWLRTLNTLNNQYHDAYQTAMTDRHKKEEDDTKKSQDKIKDTTKTTHEDMNKDWDKALKDMNTSTDKRFNDVYKTTDKWLDKVKKRIDKAAKDLGVPSTDTPVGGGGAQGGDSPATTPGGGPNHAKMAHGGYPGKVIKGMKDGKGKLYYAGEEDDELIIPLAAHRRDRAKNLVKHAAGVVGLAMGGTIPDSHGEKDPAYGVARNVVSAAMAHMAAGGSTDTLDPRHPRRKAHHVDKHIKRMLHAAHQLQGKPYTFGGHHPGGPNGWDCSSTVSHVVGSGGFPVHGGQDTSVLRGWGRPGHGKKITVAVTPTDGADGHTMMKIGHRYFEANGPAGHPIGWRSGWNPRAHFTVFRHPPGLALGGHILNNMRSITEASTKAHSKRDLLEAGGVPRNLIEKFAAETTDIMPGMASGGHTRGGSPQSRLQRMIAMANAIDAKHYNYEWGGGHNSGMVPTHGTGHGSGPGIGFDCSGAVGKVLQAGGYFGPTDSAPVSGAFSNMNIPGPGVVTTYSNGTHVYMSLNGRAFGTSGANPGGGAGWFGGGARPGFVVRHLGGLDEDAAGAIPGLGATLGSAAGAGGAPQVDLPLVPRSLLRKGGASVVIFRKLQQLKRDLKSGMGAGAAGAIPGLGDFTGGGDASANIQLGQRMAAAAGWTGAEWAALRQIWQQESGWRTNAWNRPGDWSSAYGIPQAMPGTKMASAGSDWKTNPATQIKWGINYIKGRYKKPSVALAGWNGGNFNGVKGYAQGIDNVITDRIAMLHRGERVQNAAEASSHRAARGTGPDTETTTGRQYRMAMLEAAENVKKIEKHTKSVDNKTEKEKKKNELAEVNARVRRAFARSESRVERAYGRGQKGDPTGGEGTDALVRKETATFQAQVKKDTASDRALVAEMNALKKVTSTLVSTTKAGTVAHTRAVEAQKQTTQAQKAAAAVVKYEGTKAGQQAVKDVARIKYVADAAQRGINKDLMKAITGRSLSTKARTVRVAQRVVSHGRARTVTRKVTTSESKAYDAVRKAAESLRKLQARGGSKSDIAAADKRVKSATATLKAVMNAGLNKNAKHLISLRSIAATQSRQARQSTASAIVAKFGPKLSGLDKKAQQTVVKLEQGKKASTSELKHLQSQVQKHASRNVNSHAKHIAVSISHHKASTTQRAAHHKGSTLQRAGLHADSKKGHADNHKLTRDQISKHVADHGSKTKDAVDKVRSKTDDNVKVSRDSDNKRSKSEIAADKRERDFQRAALTHLNDIAAQTPSVNITNHVSGATMSSNVNVSSRRRR